MSAAPEDRCMICRRPRGGYMLKGTVFNEPEKCWREANSHYGVKVCNAVAAANRPDEPLERSER